METEKVEKWSVTKIGCGQIQNIEKSAGAHRSGSVWVLCQSGIPISNNPKCVNKSQKKGLGSRPAGIKALMITRNQSWSACFRF
jgi:hypothetical protein